LILYSADVSKDLMMHAETGRPWIVSAKWPRQRQPRLRLFCLPYAGGDAAIYRLWPDDLPPEIEVCAVQLPGRADRLDEPPFTDVLHGADVLAAALAPYRDAPYAIFGHSMGAALAYETARALVTTYGVKPACLIASGRRAPHLPPRKAPVHHLPDQLLIEELKRLNGTPSEVLENAEIMELMLPILRSDFRLAETYRASVPIALPCAVIALGAHRDDDVAPADLDAWREVSNGEFRRHLFVGDHFFINTERRSVTKTVGAELLRFMQ
jgi:medium-chain acyl-[acyl-carrier-protein] hydrolase